MPVVYIACPQCERPLDLDLARDGPTVACPCCDRRIEVPPAGLCNAPTTVWLAAVLTVLLPLGLVPAAILYLPSAWYALGLLVPVLGLAGIAAAILLSRRWAWIVALVLGSAGGLGALGLGFVGLPFAYISGSLGDWIVSAGTVAAVSGCLVVLLLLPGCRGWCDR